jgi:hypothetical protein
MGCILKFSLEVIHFTFLERDVSTVIWILHCYYCNKNIHFFPNFNISHLALPCVASCTPHKLYTCSFRFGAAAIVVIVQVSDPYVSVGTGIIL